MMNMQVRLNGGISESQVVSAVKSCFSHSDVLKIYGGYENNLLVIIEFDGVSVAKWICYGDNIDKFLVEKTIDFLELETLM